MKIMEDYRILHRIPELDCRLPKTMEYIRKSLMMRNCKLFSPTEGSLCAFFDRRKPETLAFRADCDALPIREQTNLPFSSVHEGVMHACGHDGHTAILLELARRIRKEGNCNILLIFQPGEETAGGARKLCDTGVLEQYRVRAIFGLHLWPGLEKGVLYSRPGILMSSSAPVTAEFLGKAVHIAQASKGADALDACCRFYRMAQNMPCFLKFGKQSGGSAGNVLCDRAVLEGSLRTMTDGEKNKAQLKMLCRRACECTGCRGSVVFGEGYPAVRNDKKLYEKAVKIGAVRYLPKPFWTADDFSYYQQKVPGVYFLLGVGDTMPLHSPRFSFDENVLSAGADFFETLSLL